MKKLKKIELSEYIEANIPDFHAARLDSLSKLRLNKALLRKNPYLFKAKNIVSADQMVRALLDAHLSSQEETLFGTFLERLAEFVCKKTLGGRKSAAEGIDVEFINANIAYLVAIKSGPNWGNSSQIARMRDNFKKAKRILTTNSKKWRGVIAINGCCYGREARENKGDYLKICGQNFWKFISGSNELYTEIIEPIGDHAKERNEQFTIEYGKVINRFTREFINEFCDADGSIIWEKIVRLISSRDKPSGRKHR